MTPRTNHTTETNAIRQRRLDERLEKQGRRIDALRRAELPGSAARSGYSAQLAGISHRFEANKSNILRLTNTPDDTTDWERMHARLDAALAKLDEDLGDFERDVQKGRPV